MTTIAVPLFVGGRAAVEETLAQAAAGGADMVELRCDQAAQQDLSAALAAARAAGAGTLKAIVTVRPAWEGGRFGGSEAERIALLLHAIASSADYVDIELEALHRTPGLWQTLLEARHAAGSRTQLIVSNHCFAGRPHDLHQRLERLRAVAGADIIKLAWHAEDITDAVTALALGQQAARCGGPPLVAIAMGEAGLISRLAAAASGAPFTFALPPGAEATAPGQPRLEELLSVYRWKQQNRATELFGVVGFPVGHSKSPLIHNAGFGARGHNGLYLPLRVGPNYVEFEAAITQLLEAFPARFGGVSVTIPHKENALRFAQERSADIEPIARRIGAVNTLVFAPSGGIRALNSDYAGCLAAVCAGLGVQPGALRGKQVVVLGAGGAARAAVAAMASQGAMVAVAARSLAKAAALAAQFQGLPGAVVPAVLGAPAAAPVDIYINCTPVGMFPHVDASPLPADCLRTGQAVFDTVYNPVETQLLAQARRRGAIAISGLEMFVQQAAIQYQAFTGQAAPVDLFRSLMRGRDAA